MPCSSCSAQFNIFKRKRCCVSCQCLYCNNCLGKRKKQVMCLKCEIIHISSKRELMELKTKDLIFFLQSRKINIAGIVEKEELCNLIINHINSNAYYNESATTNSSATSSPNTEFDNYAQTFDQVKQNLSKTCQNLFTSITDKISSDLQKTTCFNQPANQQNKKDYVTTQQPRRMFNNANVDAPGTSNEFRISSGIPSTSDLHNATSIPKASSAALHHIDCDCSDDEIHEISEKRQSIFDSAGASTKKTKLSNSSSADSSSFEEVLVAKQQSDDDWQFIEQQNSAERSSNERTDDANFLSSPIQVNNNDNSSGDIMCQSFVPSNSSATNAEIRRLTRRRSDSSLLNIRKSSSINIDTSSFNPSSHSSNNDVKKIKVSCKKCGKAKSKIKQEILKLSEQLKSSNKSEDEINAKVKEFMEYLELRSQPSDMTETETEESQLINENNENSFVPNSSSHDEIEENIFDENEGINVYASVEEETATASQPSCSSSQTPKKFISLGDINSSADLEAMTVKQLKELLMLNRVDFKGCCEKDELKERVRRLWESHVSAPPSDKLSTDDLCKICMDAPIECVFLECGHSVTCTACGKVLSECAICRAYISRVVRIFKS